MVLKALNERGVRLNIKKATLRHWRSEFARNLRTVGVEANATERAVRGQHRKARKDGIYRAAVRGDSTYMNTHAQAFATGLVSESSSDERGQRKLATTQRAVESGWRSLADLLERGGDLHLASDVRRFVGGMSPSRNDWEVVRESPEFGRHEVHVRG